MSLQKLFDLHKAQSDLQAAWYRQLLTLASGGLALLAGLSPDVPAGMGKYFLAGTWVFLGTGIVSGAAATYLEVDLAASLAKRYREELQQSLHQTGHPVVQQPVVATPSAWLLRAKTVMVFSLLLAVCCLVTYSVLRALI